MVNTVWVNVDHGHSQLQNHSELVAKIESIYHARFAHKCRSIARDTTHPAHHLFERLPSDKPIEASRLEPQGLGTTFTHRL